MIAKFAKRITALVLSFLMLTTMFFPIPTFAEGGGSTDPVDAEGVETSKTVKSNGKGGFTITMEAYTTGEVEKKPVPLDIVLLIDQSYSMRDDFGTDTRQNAMKKAVRGKNLTSNDGFIYSVGQKFSSEADHRIAIATFGTGAKTVYNWAFANSKGVSDARTAVNNLSISGTPRTEIDAGMTQVASLFSAIDSVSKGNSLYSENTERQKVLIVFTDGVPTKNGQSRAYDFNPTVANSALASAQTLKAAGVMVYTIGIFSGADEEQLYGSGSNGKVGTSWSGGAVNNGDSAVDYIGANRFLNLLSSNSKSAKNIGADREYSSGYPQGTITYTITKEYQRNTLDSKAYYFTASTADKLSDVFDQIASALNTIDLGTNTKVADIVTPYFSVPADAKDVNVYTAEAYVDNGKIAFKDRTSDSSVTASIKDDTVSVTGFDFKENCVTKDEKEDHTHGKKLIIEFDIYPKEGFLGGDDIPTNDDTKSGLYDKDGNLVENFVAQYPDNGKGVDVPVPDDTEMTLTAPDRNIYLLGSLTKDNLLVGSTLEIKGQGQSQGITLYPDKANYGLSDDQKWIAEYVDILFDASGAVSSATTDSQYTVTATIKGKSENTENKSDKTGTGNINVWMPKATFKDSDIYIGSTADYTNSATTEWVHKSSTTKPAGNAPTVEYTYTPTAGKFTADTYVNVSAKIDTTSVDQYITFAHTDHDNCTFDKTKGEFIVHVWTPTITFNDTAIFLGETVSDYTANQTTPVVWNNENSTNKPSGDAPELSYTFEPTPGAFEKDTYVKVTKVLADETTDITDAVKNCYVHANCSLVDKCSFDSSKGQFIVHVKSCSLTISKENANQNESNNIDSFVINVSGPKGANSKNYQVVLGMGESVTIKDLPVGEYTVTENTDWAWRYTPSYKNGNTVTNKAELSKTTTSATIKVTNTKDTNNWLDYSDAVDNLFTKDGGKS